MRTGKRACEADVEEDGAVIEEVLKKPKGEEYVISSSSGVLAEEYNRRPPMNYEVANGKNSMEIDEDLHSRQLAVYGRETMRRLFASSVLVSGLQGLGAEIGKLSLMGSLKAKSTKKEMGNFKFAGKASQRQTYLKTGADFHPVYSELLEGINDKLLNSESNANRPDIVNKVVYDLLQHGEEWNKFRRTSLKKKIDHCILLDNFVPDVGVSMDARAKALQSHSKRSQKHMSRQQHRKYGSFDMPKEFHKVSTSLVADLSSSSQCMTCGKSISLSSWKNPEKNIWLNAFSQQTCTVLLLLLLSVKQDLLLV